MKRRDFVAGSLVSAALMHKAIAEETATSTNPKIPLVEKAATHNFEQVAVLAKELSKSDYKEDKLKMAGPFIDLSYDRYRGIRFKRSADPLLQGGNGFGMDLLPPGRYYQDRVRIFIVNSDGKSEEILFTPEVFDFDPKLFVHDNLQLNDIDKAGLSWSGFRLRFPINNEDIGDEFAVFQGASYFRAVARDTLYGLSARGLAIKTANPEGEEFPRFSQFWVYRPALGARSIKVDALLESKSITGAYRFEIIPGADTVFIIKCVLFPRRDIVSYGIAPLTSMYYFSPTRRKNIDDYRNAVHDSNGLAMFTGTGARLWRPLSNPTILQFSAFLDNHPKGFGLLQRARTFVDFEDAEARYEKRPSAWVEPLGDWGKGNVSLIEIPTDSEFNDNIITFWNGAEPLKTGQKYEYNYDLIWSQQGAIFSTRAKIISTRIGKSVNDPKAYTVSIDYTFPNGKTIEPNKLTFTATASKGEIPSSHIFLLPNSNILRASFEYRADKGQAAELQAGLSENSEPVAETWMYRWTAE
ncbi:glucan biosynthesis protein [Suttonella ornithocola]|uniref:Glucans biosynthesis protein G n=1 Tax=Suttonella ornithocola TaxID=279832 RepID=A0A380N095_9GAMM|nr:glucan biosynthesis protein G [Suttonella ornithocola]SUO97167.1 Glucans biosynthesis protein G precursor [Suttonella ornithocola]